ncbi:MAG: OsmC family protein [Mucilaginibacter sp.]|uniref:OsmC family protein n=1 Tax=Mucilaginibacter sp. TaxID=1882438 RepID=UPI0031A9CB3E
MLNGINLEGLNAYSQLITEKPDEAISTYGVTAKWLGGVKTMIHTHNQNVGTKEAVKDFNFTIDEPEELLGSNSFPTPQDYLLGGLAGCMMLGFVVGASAKGIALQSVELRINGNLNLRGFLNIDSSAPVGFDQIEFNYAVKGSGTQDDYDEIIKHVQQFSPNYRTITDAVKILATKV